MSNERPLIISLPQEMVDMITNHLTTQDISRLSRSCKMLRAATLMFLYKEVSMRWEGPAMKDDAYSPRLDLLLRTILEAPDLAKSVISVSLHAAGFRGRCWKKPCLPLPTASQIQLFEAASRKMRLPQTDEWRVAIEQSETDALVCLLLAACTNLTSLTLGLDFIRDNKFLPDFLAGLATVPVAADWACFQNLQKVQLGARVQSDVADDINDETHWHNISKSLSPRAYRAYLTFLHAPAIEVAKMTLGRLSPHWGNQGILDLPPMPTLTSLYFFDSDVHPQSLQGILRSAPALVELSYGHWTATPAHRALDLMDCTDLQEALEPVKDSLTWFELTCDYYANIIQDAWECKGRYIKGSCSFQAFTALKSLRIPVCALFGWSYNSAPSFSDVLPPTLVTLCLRFDYCSHADFEWKGPAFIKHSTEFLQNERWREVTPHLKHFDVHRIDIYDDDEGDDVCLPEEECKEFENLCVTNGVACKIYSSQKY